METNDPPSDDDPDTADREARPQVRSRSQPSGDWSVLHDLLEEQGLEQRELAARLGYNPSLLNKLINGVLPTAAHQDKVGDICDILLPMAAVANEPQDARRAHERRRSRLVQQLSDPRRHASDVALKDIKVLPLRYGYLPKPGAPVGAEADENSGPTGFLTRIFRRFATVAAAPELRPTRGRRAEVSRALYGQTDRFDVHLGNLATIRRLNAEFFVCLPISIAANALIHRDPRAFRNEPAAVESIRATLRGDKGEGASRISPLYMRNEIGAHLAGVVLARDVPSRAWIDELEIDSLVRAMQAAQPRERSLLVLFIDELTCLLAMRACRARKIPVSLGFNAVNPGPRYPFGFSMARGDKRRYAWIRLSWEFYVRSDSDYLVTHYARLYEEMVGFRRSVEDDDEPSGETPEAWARRVLGLDQPTVTSSLVGPYWTPILMDVRRKIGS